MRNKYVFEKDDHCITLYKRVTIKDPKSKNFGQETNRLVGYFSTVDSLINKLVHLELIKTGTVEDLLIDLKEVNHRVSDLVQECMK